MTDQNISIYVPIMTQESFAKKIGVSDDTVRGMIRTTILPSIKIGKRRWVNIAKLNVLCLEKQIVTKNNS